MWERIKDSINRAVNGIAYNIFEDEVECEVNYDIENKQICLIVYDEFDEEIVFVNKKFNFDLESMELEFMGEFKAKDIIIPSIEKYLIENYS
jgi:hypothetical protein